MKWRSPLAYLLVLLMVGGYYYYFEVVQKKHKEMAAKEAKKVFHFQADSVDALTIKPKEKETVELKKDGQWQILQPIKVEADKFSVQDFLDALSKLEAEREVVAAPSDLKPFGLLEPSLTISFPAGEKRYELLIGDKNPAGDGSYAKTADKTNVFLISQGNLPTLNRGVNELRRRQLFTFQLDDVIAVNIVWWDGNSTVLERVSGEKDWKAPANPELKIKGSKIDNVIEQLHWLRALNFLENEPRNLAPYGLEPPFVIVTMRLKSGGNAELRLARKEQDEKQIAALSSQLPSVVQVAAGTLDDIPRNVMSLQDRSLLGFKPDEVKQVEWTLGESQGRVVRLDDNNWGIKEGDKPPGPLKDSWRVRSLLWDLGDAEFKNKLDPAQPGVSNPYCRIELRDTDKSPLTLIWDKLSQEGREPVPVWVQSKEETVAVSVDAETLRRVEGDLERISSRDKQE